MNLKKFIKAALLFALIWFGGSLTYWFFWDATEPGTPGRALTDDESREHRRLLKKHGDYPVYYYSDKPDEKYFIRDGKKCRWM